MLALEAFKIAGDPTAFPEQLQKDGLAPWHPKRIFWNAFRGGKERPTLKLDIGGYLPLLGESVGQISALSRSSHRSQGYGSVASIGSRLDEFQPLDDLPAGSDLFAGIDHRSVLASRIEDRSQSRRRGHALRSAEPGGQCARVARHPPFSDRERPATALG